MAELIAQEGYPGQRRIPAFDAQSLTLTRWLSERDEPTKVLKFLAQENNLATMWGYQSCTT